MIKKWVLAASAALLLTACSDERDRTPNEVTVQETTETFESVVEGNAIDITPVATPNDDVQAVIDMTEPTTFASFIYSMSDESYLLINSEEAVTVTADDTETTLHIRLEHDGTKAETTATRVYAVAFSHQYDTIQLFENGEEISFDIWTE